MRPIVPGDHSVNTHYQSQEGLIIVRLVVLVCCAVLVDGCTRAPVPSEPPPPLPCCDLRVRVFDGDPAAAKFVLNAKIMVLGPAFASAQPAHYGFTIFSLPAGEYNIRITHREYEPRSYHLTLEAWTQLDASLIPLEPPITPDLIRLPSPAVQGVLCVALLLGLVYVPRFQTRRIMDYQKRLELTNETRRTLAQLVGGSLVLAGLYLSLQQANNARAEAGEVVRQERLARLQGLQVQHLNELTSLATVLATGTSTQRMAAVQRLRRIALDAALHAEVISVLREFKSSAGSTGDSGTDARVFGAVDEVLGQLKGDTTAAVWADTSPQR